MSGPRTHIRLPDGIEVWVEAPREEVQRTIRDAVGSKQMIDVNVDDETMVTINPFQIIYIESKPAPGKDKPWTSYREIKDLLDRVERLEQLVRPARPEHPAPRSSPGWATPRERSE